MMVAPSALAIWIAIVPMPKNGSSTMMPPAANGGGPHQGSPRGRPRPAIASAARHPQSMACVWNVLQHHYTGARAVSESPILRIGPGGALLVSPPDKWSITSVFNVM